MCVCGGVAAGAEEIGGILELEGCVAGLRGSLLKVRERKVLRREALPAVYTPFIIYKLKLSLSKRC